MRLSFLTSARAAAQQLGLPEAMLARPVNEGFSGGERKRNELLQLALLQPRLAFLDEIDSGMDVDGVRAVVLACAPAARKGHGPGGDLPLPAPDRIACARYRAAAGPGLHCRNRGAGPGTQHRQNRFHPQPRTGGGLSREHRQSRCTDGPGTPGRVRLDCPAQRVFRHLPPPPAGVWLGESAEKSPDSCDASPLSGTGWTLYPVGDTLQCSVAARWLDASDPQQRAELFSGLAQPGDSDASPSTWARRALCRQGLRLRVGASPSEDPGKTVWLHLRHQSRSTVEEPPCS